MKGSGKETFFLLQIICKIPKELKEYYQQLGYLWNCRHHIPDGTYFPYFFPPTHNNHPKGLKNLFLFTKHCG
jgi:hypothetical protein